jgi:hypothetical protein
VHYREGERGVQVCFLFGLVGSIINECCVGLLYRRRKVVSNVLHGIEKNRLMDSLLLRVLQFFQKQRLQ